MEKPNTNIRTGLALAALTGLLFATREVFVWAFGKLLDKASSLIDSSGIDLSFFLSIGWSTWLGGFLALTACYFLWRGYQEKTLDVSTLDMDQSSENTKRSVGSCIIAEQGIVRNVRLSRAQDATSRWWANFTMIEECPRLQICLDLQYHTVSGERDHPRWSGVTRHVVETRENLARSQTLSIQFVRDARGHFGIAPHWEIPGPREQPSNYIPAMAGFVRGAITFITGSREQQHRFIALPWEPDQALVVVGEEMLCGESFWSAAYRPMNLHDAKGLRSIPQRHEA